MKLYYMPGVCSLAAHILLREAGLDFELERVGRDRKTEGGADFMTINPKGYVPALRLDDGSVLTENVVIHGYIADLNPAARLAPPRGGKERLELDELAVFVTTEIHKTFTPLFMPAMADEARTLIRNKLLERYRLIEERLSDGRPFLTGEDFSTADSYLFVCSRWAPGVGVDLSGFSRLGASQDRIAQRPAVRAALAAEGLT